VAALSAQTTSFEAAAIRLNTESGPMIVMPPNLHKGALSASKATLRQMIEAAYKMTPARVIGPEWLDANRFDISGRAPAGVPDGQFRPMFQALLKDRFHLAAHSEMREMPVYYLRVAAGGVKMTTGNTPDAGPKNFDHSPEMRGFPMMRGSGTPAEIADLLSSALGRPIIDKTGLTIRYNFFLSYAPLAPQAGNAIPETGPPDIFTAVQKQLGMRLEAGKDMVEVIVVDHMDPIPTEN
jgi:uncharacterized protein (TIGR03435 family)